MHMTDFFFLQKLHLFLHFYGDDTKIRGTESQPGKRFLNQLDAAEIYGTIWHLIMVPFIRYDFQTKFMDADSVLRL